MPSMANITVKKADNTDVTYVAIVPSAGDRTKAIWRVESIGQVAGIRPTLEISSKGSANGEWRIVDGKVTYPETITDTTTGVTSVYTRDLFSFTSTVNLTGKDSTHKELAKQSAGLLMSDLVQQVIITGYGPQ